MIKDLKKPSNTEKLCLDVAKRVGKHNIPAIFIAYDTDNNHPCVVMDARKEMREINVNLLLDAMMNGEDSRELINVILGASAIMAAEIPSIEEHFLSIIQDMKKKIAENSVEIPSTDNVAEA